MTVDKMAESLKKLRKKLNMSQQEFGEALGVSNRAVSKWEKGLSKPGMQTWLKISERFNVPIDKFIKPAREEIKTDRVKTKKTTLPSIKGLYKIGRGPSSSHTMAPEKVCKIFKKKYEDADFFEVHLFGSLAKNGRGSLTDKVIERVFYPVDVKIHFDYSGVDLPHPNTMELYAFKKNKKLGFMRAYSTGGGDIEAEGEVLETVNDVYPFNKFEQIANYCFENNKKLWQVVEEFEGEGIWEYLEKIWETMKKTIQKGLEEEGTLPGGLDVKRKAKFLFNQRHMDESSETKQNRIVCSYAFATSEQNACGGIVVTAPTCGASGVLPAVLLYNQEKRGFTDKEIYRALAVAGLVGTIIKTNASISGAECGCQAEIGTACSMAAAALGQLFGLEIDQIEYAAEVAMEHHLGLTCDPIAELVQIPCIERNAVAAMRAINSVSLANFLSGSRKISFDLVIDTMYETGKDMSKNYRETSEGGLAKLYN